MLVRHRATQRRAARYACHNFHQTASVTEMITKLEWQTQENIRKFQKLTMFYKIINSIVAINILKHASKSTRPTRSNQTNNFIPILTRTSYHKASFFPSTIPMWNSLAESVKTSTRDTCLCHLQRLTAIIQSSPETQRCESAYT